ncbi:MAG: N-formylglutamate amidohydrolase [Pseudomonadota bacterium]
MDTQTYDPVEEISAGPEPVIPGLVLLCDHASNAIPPAIGTLGLPSEDMARHIAWDIGARDVVLALAAKLGAPAVLSRFSRLVIDPNRGPKDPTLVMRLYDGTPIPGNRAVDADDISARRANLHQPYHDRISAVIDGMIAAGTQPHLISVHSFTRQLRGKASRPWHAGVLWDQDFRLAGPLLDILRADGDLVVGDNEPYLGSLPGDTMWTHGTSRGLPHALIEIRNDLIADEFGASAWADRLAQLIPEAVWKMENST